MSVFKWNSPPCLAPGWTKSSSQYLEYLIFLPTSIKSGIVYSFVETVKFCWACSRGGMRVLNFYLSSNISSFPFLFSLREGWMRYYTQGQLRQNNQSVRQQSDGNRSDGLLVYKWHNKGQFSEWTDARHPVLRPRIRSAEVHWERRYGSLKVSKHYVILCKKKTKRKKVWQMVALVVLEAVTAARHSHTSTRSICDWWLKQTEKKN